MAILSATQYNFLSIAALESKKSDLMSCHGCVIVSNGKIIGRGHNSSRSQSSDGFICNTCSCHAEISAIRNAFHTNLTDTYGKYKKRLESCILRS